MLPADEHPFLDAILASPSADGPRLVYADYLDETGNPLDARRAELVRVQVALERVPAEQPRHGELKNREVELVAAFGAAWMAPWASLRTEFQFRRGLPDAVAIDAATFLARGEELFDNTQTQSGRSFIRRVKLREAARTLPDLVNCPLLQRIEELDLGWCDLGNGGVSLLMRSPHLGTLRSLDLGNNRLDDAGAIAVARAAALPRLQALALNDNGQIGSAGAAAIADSPFLAGLHSLDLSGNEIDEHALQRLLGGEALARLTRLVICENPIGRGLSRLIGDSLFNRMLNCEPSCDWHKCDLDASGAATLAASPESARIERLNLGDNYLGDAGVETLVRGKWDKLRSLELARNRLTDAGAFALLAAALPELKRLDLAGNRLTHRGVDALKAASVERGFSLDAANNGTETVIPLPAANPDVQEVAQLRGGISFPARR
ncbi:MAG TPA: TIGR02996 domain-containing protein [Gemmataceae bacterium]|jgi:uncharacterized protein (TIGR02996 family)